MGNFAENLNLGNRVRPPLLTVGLTTYQHISLLSNTHYSAALLIPFDRR